MLLLLLFLLLLLLLLLLKVYETCYTGWYSAALGAQCVDTRAGVQGDTAFGRPLCAPGTNSNTSEFPCYDGSPAHAELDGAFLPVSRVRACVRASVRACVRACVRSE